MLLLSPHAARGAMRRPRAVARGELRPRAVAAAHRCLGNDARRRRNHANTNADGAGPQPAGGRMEVMNRPQHLTEALDITPLGYYPSDLALRYVDFLSSTFDLRSVPDYRRHVS